MQLSRVVLISALSALSCTSLGARAEEPRARTPLSSPDAAAPKAKGDLVEALLAQMTLEEKAGQLTQWGAQQTPTGPRVKAGGEEDIKRGRVGSFLGAWGVETTGKLQRVAVEQSRLKIPLLFSFDVIHGSPLVSPRPGRSR